MRVLPPPGFVRPASTAPAPPPGGSGAPVPGQFPSGAWDYAQHREHAQEEPPELRGVVFLQFPDQEMRVLKWSGQTRPEPPPGQPSDIPPEAVRFNRVVISIDGIHQEWGEHQRQIYRFLHNGGPPGGSGGDVAQPVIGIHEGSGPSEIADGARIGKDLSLLKALQSGLAPAAWVAEKVATIDPAVKALHDTVRQCLQQDHDVQLMCHSGGGAETALALSILSREEGGRFKQAVADRVRLLAMAPACSYKDLTRAGLKKENVYYTASRHDPVWRIFHHHLYVCPLLWPLNALGVVAAARWLVSDKKLDLAYHSPDYIFEYNKLPNGKQQIQEFFTGSPGGEHRLP